jgi:hypothetical protein
MCCTRIPPDEFLHKHLCVESAFTWKITEGGMRHLTGANLIHGENQGQESFCRLRTLKLSANEGLNALEEG